MFLRRFGKFTKRLSGLVELNGRSGRICDYRFEPLKSLKFSHVGFDFVYSPCVLVSRSRTSRLREGANWSLTWSFPLSFPVRNQMSAFGGKADMTFCSANVRL